LKGYIKFGRKQDHSANSHMPDGEKEQRNNTLRKRKLKEIPKLII
jgi:hypothetical protein